MRNEYIKVWKRHHGEIPKDENGRRYEIHHIDGNRSNNSIENLKLVTIEEHYQIHYKQRDWAACLLISSRMKTDSKEKSKLASLSNENRIRSNNHPFLDPEVREKAQSILRERIINGTHHLQNRHPEWNVRQVETYIANGHNRSEIVKDTWKDISKEDRVIRTKNGSIAGANKTKGTKWYNLNGKHMRAFPDDPLIELQGWKLGRIKIKQ